MNHTEIKATIEFQKIKTFSQIKSTTTEAALLLGSIQKENRPHAPGKALKEFSSFYNSLHALKTYQAKAGSLATILQKCSPTGHAHLMGLGVGTPADCHPQNILVWGGGDSKRSQTTKIYRSRNLC